MYVQSIGHFRVPMAILVTTVLREDRQKVAPRLEALEKDRKDLTARNEALETPVSESIYAIEEVKEHHQELWEADREGM